MEKRSIPSNIQPPRPIACNSSTPEVRGRKLGLRQPRIAELGRDDTRRVRPAGGRSSGFVLEEQRFER
jgi:hypothetical protein